jgi:hypothetical protein
LLWPLCHACGQHACACHNRHHCKTNSHCWSLDRTNCRASFHFFGEIAKCLPTRDGRVAHAVNGARKPGITTSTAALCGLDVLLDFFQIERWTMRPDVRFGSWRKFELVRVTVPFKTNDRRRTELRTGVPPGRHQARP